MENSAVSSAPPFRLTFEDLEQPTYVSLLASDQIYWWWNYHSQHAECIIHNPSMSVFASLVCSEGCPILTSISNILFLDEDAY